jgi:hypothetical protein
VRITGIFTGAGTPPAAATVRVDNVTISGDATGVVPEPASILCWAALALAGSWKVRRNWFA